jgi:hypothetical protein
MRSAQPRRPSISSRPLLWSALLIGAVGPGCTKVCDDDGFAWQQDPACLAQLSITATESGTDPTETA